MKIFGGSYKDENGKEKSLKVRYMLTFHQMKWYDKTNSFLPDSMFDIIKALKTGTVSNQFIDYWKVEKIKNEQSCQIT